MLLGGVIAAGGTHRARIEYSLNAAQFGVVIAVFAAGLVLLAALALVPRRRVYLATNVVVALLSGFLAVQLVQVSVTGHRCGRARLATDRRVVRVRTGAAVSCSTVTPRTRATPSTSSSSGANGRTHTGGADAPLADYPGFGSPVLAPADGRIVGVADGYADNPPGTNSDRANHVVIDIGAGRYVPDGPPHAGQRHGPSGGRVRRGQPLAAVGNNGHSSEPHLHLQVQDSPAGMDAERTYPMVFRNVHITRGGAWPWGDSRELRTGDLVQALGQ